MTAPAYGTFIRPVGVFGYCLEVVRVVAADDESGEQWQCRRYGMDEQRQPFKDGHSDMHYMNNLKQIAPGVWKDEWPFDTPRWMCCPLYYRRIDVAGQMGLF
jgi:hypothetical protein